MNPPDDFGQMPTGDFSRIQDLCEQLEQAWKESEGSPDGVDLEPFLQNAGNDLRLSALYELIKTEMSYRLENNLPWDISFYLEKYQELKGADSLSPSLILEECLVRKKHGLKISLTNYKKRFPRQFPALEKLLDQQDSSPINPKANSTPNIAETSAAPMDGPSPLFGFGPGRTIANHFVVQKRLGGGAYGEVWKVLDTNGGIEKALKIIMHSMDTEEAKTELLALEKIKNLESPFILRTDSYWVEEGRLLIVMELARGGSLRDCLRKYKQEGNVGVPIAELFRYIKEAAEALDYLHGEKIVHRDIKPDNILLVGSHAKIADLGLAKLMTGERSMTVTNPLGSAPYMAPEVWNERISSRSDQYSLVVSYAELRQGKLPFKGNKITDFFMAHLKGSASLDSSIILEPEMEVILKGLSRDPAQRFLSCSDFVEALEEAVPERRRPKELATGIKKLSTPQTKPALGKPNHGEVKQNNSAVIVAPEPPTALHNLECLREDSPSSRPDGISSPGEFHKTETPRDTASTRDKNLNKPPVTEEPRQKPQAKDTGTKKPNLPETGPAKPSQKKTTPADLVAKPTPRGESSFGTITPNQVIAVSKKSEGPKPTEVRPPLNTPAQPLLPSKIQVPLTLVDRGQGLPSPNKEKETRNIPLREKPRYKKIGLLALFSLIGLILVVLGVLAALVNSKKTSNPGNPASISPLQGFDDRLRNSKNSKDFKAHVAEVKEAQLDLEIRNQYLAKIKMSWLNQAKKQLENLEYAKAKETADELPAFIELNDQEKGLLRKIHDQAEKALNATKPAKDEKEKADKDIPIIKSESLRRPSFPNLVIPPLFNQVSGFIANTRDEALKIPDRIGERDKKMFRLVLAGSSKEIRAQMRQSAGTERKPPFEEWKYLIGQALQFAETDKKNPEVAKRLALWLGAKNWLARLYPEQSWEGSLPEFTDAYDRAQKVGLDNKEQAELLSGKITLEAYKVGAKKLGDEQWDRLKRLADAALKKDPTNPYCHVAQAYVLLNHTRGDRRLDSQKEKYEAALKETRQAFELYGSGKNEDFADCCLLYSTISLDMGKFKNASSPEHLDNAWKFAKKALEENSLLPPPALIYLAYGNAFEDIEILLKEKKDRNFDKAIAKFQEGLEADRQAPEKGGNQAKLLVALGRDYYLGGEFTNRKTYLEQAKKNLNLALDTKHDASEEPEAYYWLGKAFKMADPEIAKAKFNLSFQGAEKLNQKSWIILSKGELADMELLEADALFKAGNKARKGENEEEAKKCWKECLRKIDAARTILVMEDFKEDYQYEKQMGSFSLIMATYAGLAHRGLDEPEQEISEYNKVLPPLGRPTLEKCKWYVLLYENKVNLIAKQGFSKKYIAPEPVLDETQKIVAWVNNHSKEISKTHRQKFLANAKRIQGKLSSALSEQIIPQNLQNRVEALRLLLDSMPINEK